MEGIPLVIDELSLHTIASYIDELGLQVPNELVHSWPLNLFHPGKQFAKGFCIGSEAQKRFADVTIICTIYIQMFLKKNTASKFTDGNCVQIRKLISFL